MVQLPYCSFLVFDLLLHHGFCHLRCHVRIVVTIAAFFFRIIRDESNTDQPANDHNDQERCECLCNVRLSACKCSCCKRADQTITDRECQCCDTHNRTLLSREPLSNQDRQCECTIHYRKNGTYAVYYSPQHLHATRNVTRNQHNAKKCNDT